MSDYTLTAISPLGDHNSEHGGIRLTELSDLAIVSIALPLDAKKAQLAIESAFSTGLPEVGKSTMSGDGIFRLARLGRDLVFVLFRDPSANAEQMIAARLQANGYTTDQSDAWVGLEISGQNVRAALARICPLDLHPDAFENGDAARTVMEHLGVLIVCTGPDTFMLLSASSSAQSFLHAVEVSIRNVS